MKLHLPQNLRKAIIACIATVTSLAYTLPAGAIELTDAVATGSNGATITLDPATGAITAVAVVDIATLSSAMAKGATLTKKTIINFDGNNDIGLQTNYSSLNSKINTSGIYGCWNNGGAYDFGMASGQGFENASFWANGAVAAVTLTYSHGTGTTGTFVLLDATGAVIKELGGSWNTTLKGSGITFSSVGFDSTIVSDTYVFNQVVTSGEASSLGVAAALASIPTYYWEATSTSTNWTGNNWSSTDGGTTLEGLPTTGTAKIVFNNNEDATISMSGAASVFSVSIQAGNYTLQGTSAASDSLSVGSLSVETGAVATMENLDISATSFTNAGTLNLENVTLNSAITNSGTVNLSGTINLDGFTSSSGSDIVPSGSNGYIANTTLYTVVYGGTSDGSGVTTWQVNGTTVSGTFTNGALSIANDSSLYCVASDAGHTFQSTTIDGQTATGIVLNNAKATLILDNSGTIGDGFITATENGGSINLNDKNLAQSNLGELRGAVQLTGSGTYDLGAETALKTNLSLGNNWTGTIKSTGSINTPTTALDLAAYTKNGSAVELGAVNVKSLTSGTTASVTLQSLAISEASGVNGALTLSGNTLVLGGADASLRAESLTTTGNLTVSAASQAVLEALNAKAAQDGSVTIITLTDGYTGDLATSEILVPRSRAAYVSPVEKYFVSLQWDASKTTLIYAASANPEYVAANVDASTRNGRAGVKLLTQALLTQNPQGTAPQSGLAKALDEVDAGKMTDDGAAAIAGAATAVLGMATHGDLDRQLQAIRNRTTTMGVNQTVVNDDMPYFNAWINAEGNYATLGDDGTAGGYKLTNWGGTVGFDVDFTPTFTAGMALTAMYGDLSVTGVDQAEGELNSYYVSAFARYCASAWTHTFVATAGLSDIQLDRTVMGEELEGSTDGVSFGLMYEVGRVFALDEDATSCLQPVLNITWRHTSVNGYREKGGSLALKVDDQTLDTVTVGLGARVQAIVGENMYNRTSIFEARVLAKFDIGDRRSATSVGLAGIEADIESAELGAMGLEAGAGLTIPLGDEGGSLFMDAAVELRSNYTNVNGTIGYRINF